jgi:hypothetical protein
VSALAYDPSGVDTVILWYQIVDGDRRGDWQDLSMTEVTAWLTYWEATVGSEELRLSLNPPMYGNSGTLVYIIEAYDGNGYWSRSSTGTVTVEYCLQ